MALGILEPSQGNRVPGTTRYFDDPSRTQYVDGEENGAENGEEKTTNGTADVTAGRRNLKTDGNIILVRGQPELLGRA